MRRLLLCCMVLLLLSGCRQAEPERNLLDISALLKGTSLNWGDTVDGFYAILDEEFRANGDAEIMDSDSKIRSIQLDGPIETSLGTAENITFNFLYEIDLPDGSGILPERLGTITFVLKDINQEELLGKLGEVYGAIQADDYNAVQMGSVLQTGVRIDCSRLGEQDEQVLARYEKMIELRSYVDNPIPWDLETEKENRYLLSGTIAYPVEDDAIAFRINGSELATLRYLCEDES